MLRLDHLGSQLVLELYIVSNAVVIPFQFGKLVYDEKHFPTPFLI